MKIKWLGHASFLITSKEGQRILTDPYTPDQNLKYRPINESADIVTKSHEHFDHNNAKAVGGHPVVLFQAGSQNIKGIEAKAFSAFHDESEGAQRGANLIFRFKVEGLILCHLGDLGHRLKASLLSEIGAIDILFVPVGGFFTIDARVASLVIQELNPKLVFPMHYKTTKVNLPISGIEEFLKNKSRIRRINSTEIEVSKETLPAEMEIIVLQSAN